MYEAPPQSWHGHHMCMRTLLTLLRTKFFRCLLPEDRRCVEVLLCCVPSCRLPWLGCDEGIGCTASCSVDDAAWVQPPTSAACATAAAAAAKDSRRRAAGRCPGMSSLPARRRRVGRGKRSGEVTSSASIPPGVGCRADGWSPPAGDVKREGSALWLAVCTTSSSVGLVHSAEESCSRLCACKLTARTARNDDCGQVPKVCFYKHAHNMPS